MNIENEISQKMSVIYTVGRVQRF